jgi:adenylate cyclase
MPDNTNPEAWPLPDLHRARRAIVVVDVVESVRLMQEDEAGFIERWRRFVHAVRTEVLPKFGGRLVKSLGDGMLLTFETAREAVAAAAAIQSTGDHIHPQGIELRIGIHVSDVVADELDIYGTGVNLAARVASLAEPGCVTLTDQARDEVTDGVDANVEDLGECWVKHVNQPVRAFAVRRDDRPSSLPRPSQDTLSLAIAVLPLECAHTDPSFGDYLADGLIAGLSATPQLQLISRLSTRALLDSSADAQGVGTRLGAKYVVWGAVRALAARLAIDIQLSRCDDNKVVVAHRVVCDTQDLFVHPSAPIQELCTVVHHAVLDHEAKELRSRPLPNLASYQLLLGSMGLLHRTALVDFDRAHQALGALIEREPRHGAGYTWLAKWHFLRMIRGLSDSPKREQDEGRRRAEQALERDRFSGAAWALRGLVHAYDGESLQQAEQSYVKALDCNPSEPLAWLYMGTLRSWQGRGAEAAQAAHKALSLSPLDPMRYYFESLAAAALLADGRYADTVSLAQSSLRLHRGHTPTLRVLTIAQILGGQEDAARESMALMRAAEPKLTVAQYLQRYPGRAAPHAQLYADALRAAGLPT